MLRSDYTYERTYIERVKDGDTFVAHVILADYGFEVYQMAIKTFRLSDIDTWEAFAPKGDQEHKKKGLAAKERVKELIEHQWVTLISHKNRRGSLHRWLADIWVTDPENSRGGKIKLSELLRREGFEKTE